MSTINLRLPNSLHEAARQLAEKEEISLNQLITLALAEKLSALLTEDYLGKRRRVSRKEFRRAMSKVPNREPEARDRI